jgi:hypothetical protein
LQQNRRSFFNRGLLSEGQAALQVRRGCCSVVVQPVMALQVVAAELVPHQHH